MRWFSHLVLAIGVAVAMASTAAAGIAVGATALHTSVHTDGLPDIRLQPLAVRSDMYAADGSLMSALYDQDRTPVSLDDVPPILVDAVIAVEDSSFYTHRGVSLRGVVRAVRANTEGGGVQQGGSTITQQVVKNSLLTTDRTYSRKAKEAVLALRMEQEYSKPEILQRYLNSVYFGQGAYGVASAAERFFGKNLKDLTTPEAALLAGLISSPEAFDPIRHPEAAKARRAHVLQRMEDVGFITAQDHAAAEQAPLPTEVQRPDAQPNDYFGEEVRRELLDDPRLGATPQDRFNTVFRGGIKVYTTLDPALQKAAEDAVHNIIPDGPFTGSLVTIDPADGAVKAMVGGRSFADAKYNLATQGQRQAGSAFKPITLATWLSQGHSPEDIVDTTAPCTFHFPPPQPDWVVNNYSDGEGAGPMTLREAMVHSLNCAYARVSLAAGPQDIVKMAHALGVRSDLPAVPSIVLGTGSVSPLDMASAYATFAADGVHHTPFLIRKIVARDGSVLVDNQTPGERVLSPQVARSVTDVLRNVVERGTGTAAQIGRPVAGKTGTAEEWRDAWFIGYTPQLATAVWMGSPDSQQSMVNVGGINVTGGSYPARVWAQYMSLAVGALPVADFPPPDVAAWPQPTAVVAPFDTAVPLPSPTDTNPAPAPAPAPAPKPAPSGGGGKPGKKH
ncbi:MAG TPA: PBP1A family penicillin-binding protein [Acidimicrobiales bacterium]|nr:PBP1A family penicillin-binding protein [Acidimicrobiales bacterium]